MPTEVLMPALSPTMEKGNLAKWLKKEGDKVKSGDVIAEIETDKATMEIEAADEGTLGKILVPEGTADVAVNTPIAVILSEGEDKTAIKTSQSRRSRQKAAESAPPAETEKPRAQMRRRQSPRRPPKRRRRRSRSDPDIPEGTEMVTMTMREALRDAMAEEMRRDKDVFVMGEEVAEYQGAYKVTQGLLQEFGAKRVIDTPITEHGFSGLGIGAALAGLKPVVEFMTFNFAMQAIDQLINSAAKTLYMSGGQMGCQIVFRGPNGAAARVAAQHSQDYSAWYSHIPGLKVITPSTAADAKGLLKAAIRDPNPVIFLENEILYGHSSPVPKLDDFVLPIGKAKIARVRERRDDRLLVDGHDLCAQGCRRTGERRHRCRSDRPSHAQADGHRHRYCVRAEDRPSGHRGGRLAAIGVGAEIAARIMEHAFDYLDAPVMRVRARTCRCLTLPTSKSSRFRRSPKSSRRPRLFATGRPRNAHQYPHASAVAHDGEGQSCQMAEEGRRQGQVRRCDRRDRDRQGDDGSTRPSMKARSPRSWCRKAPQDVAVNAVIAVLAGEGEDVKAAAGAAESAAPASAASNSEAWRRKPGQPLKPSLLRLRKPESAHRRIGACAPHRSQPHFLFAARASAGQRSQY